LERLKFEWDNVTHPRGGASDIDLATGDECLVWRPMDVRATFAALVDCFSSFAYRFAVTMIVAS
jgi:hypothetical protein